MKEKLNKFLSRHNQTSIFLWLIVGGYLVYLAYQILTSDMGPDKRLLLIIFSIFFILVGGLIVAVSLYSLLGKHYQMPKSLVSEEAEDAAEESEEE